MLSSEFRGTEVNSTTGINPLGFGFTLTSKNSSRIECKPSLMGDEQQMSFSHLKKSWMLFEKTEITNELPQQLNVPVIKQLWTTKSEEGSRSLSIFKI